MESYCATSDVKSTREDQSPSLSVGLISNALPEVQSPVSAENSHTGASTRSALPQTKSATIKRTKDTPHWYALRTTYGRERKAYEYLVSKNIVAFHPTLKQVKLVDGKHITTEQSRIPNLFFAYATEEQLKPFVFDNVNLPFLRFYYRHTRINNKVVKEPLIVPDYQMESLKIICAADADNTIVSLVEVPKFEKGQLVKVIDGAFKGVIGRVARWQGQQRVGVVVEDLVTVVTAYVPSAFLKTLTNGQ